MPRQQNAVIFVTLINFDAAFSSASRCPSLIEKFAAMRAAAMIFRRRYFRHYFRRGFSAAADAERCFRFSYAAFEIFCCCRAIFILRSDVLPGVIARLRCRDTLPDRSFHVHAEAPMFVPSDSFFDAEIFRRRYFVSPVFILIYQARGTPRRREPMALCPVRLPPIAMMLSPTDSLSAR